MPLELFLQVIGSTRKIENLGSYCRQGLRLCDCSEEEIGCLTSTNASGRLSWLIDVLRRLKVNIVTLSSFIVMLSFCLVCMCWLLKTVLEAHSACYGKHQIPGAIESRNEQILWLYSWSIPHICHGKPTVFGRTCPTAPLISQPRLVWFNPTSTTWVYFNIQGQPGCLLADSWILLFRGHTNHCTTCFPWLQCTWGNFLRNELSELWFDFVGSVVNGTWGCVALLLISIRHPTIST